MKKIEMTYNKIAAIVGCLLLAISPYINFVTYGGEGRNIIDTVDSIGSLIRNVVLIGCVIILVAHFIKHPKLSIIGAVLTLLVLIFIFISLQSVSGYKYKTGPAVTTLFIGNLIVWIDAFLKPIPIKSK